MSVERRHPVGPEETCWREGCRLVNGHRGKHTQPHEVCTCGMHEQERTGHAPQHADWCELTDDCGHHPEWFDNHGACHHPKCEATS